MAGGQSAPAPQGHPSQHAGLRWVFTSGTFNTRAGKPVALFLEPVTTYWLSEDTSQHRMCGLSTWREREATGGTTRWVFQASYRALSRLHVDLRLGPEARLGSGAQGGAQEFPGP